MKSNIFACGMICGMVLGMALVLLTEKPAETRESAPVVAIVPTQEAKAEPAIGVSETTEATTGSGVELPPSVVPPEPLEIAAEATGVDEPLAVPSHAPVAQRVSLREAIHEYKRKYGIRWYVSGMTEQQHLVQTHGWTQEQISGLTEDELHLLHGASHEGKINPTDFARGTPGAAVHTPTVPGKPRLKIRTAPFPCPPCNDVKGYDWSEFDVTWETGGAVNGYPEFVWTDKRGVTRLLNGRRTPKQVRWSWERTQ